VSALREGLGFALGDSHGSGKWLPSKLKEKDEVRDLDSVLDDHTSNEYEENIPLNTFPSIESEKISRPTLQINTNIPIDLENAPFTPPLNASEKSNPITPKIHNMLARISDRVAGSNSNQDDSPSTDHFNKLAPSPLGTMSNSSFYSPTKRSQRSSQENLSIHQTTLPSNGLGLFLDPNDTTGNGRENDDDDDDKLNTTQDSHGVTNEVISPLMGKSEFTRENYASPSSMYLFGNSLGFFSPSSKLRLLCHKILSNKMTNQFFLSLLILQVALLAYRQWNPKKLNGYYYSGYNWADYTLLIINVIYTVEIFSRIIAYGFWDDHIMYEELGLPYPANEIKEMFFNFTYIRKAIDKFGFSKLFGNRKQLNNSGTTTTNAYPTRKSGSRNNLLHHLLMESDKYKNQPSFDRSNGRRSGSEEEISLTENDAGVDHHLNAQNTFYKRVSIDTGKLKLRRAYIRNSWYRIDFFSMIMFWISLALSIKSYDIKHHIMVFRALSCLRILRFCNLTSGTTTILTSLKKAITQLIDVGIFIGCFWLFFGIIGVQSFNSSLTRHCVWTNPLDPSETWVNSDQHCGSYLAVNGSVMPYIMRDGSPSKQIKGFRCPKYSQCVSGENPYGGTVNFDNIFQSLEMVFVVMSANTFTDILYDTTDSDTMAASLFFIFATFILTVWLINVFIAVIVASFNDTRKVAEEKKKNKRKPNKFNIFNPTSFSTKREKLNQFRHSNVWLRTYSKFEWIFVIVVVADLFVQCFRKYGMSEFRRHTLYRFECAFTLVFLGEIVVRFAMHFPHWRLFFVSKRNCFDLFLVVLTCLIILQPIKERLGWVYYWLTVFQIMRFYRVVLATAITRNLWMQITSNIKAIFDLGLFFFILTFLVSIIGARLYEGQIPEDMIDDMNFPMHTLPNTFLGLYVITSTENWTDVMYNLSQEAENVPQRAIGSMFLIFWFILSNTVIMNIFIAIIARTLEVSEEGKRKQQLIQFIENMTNRLKYLDAESGVLTKLKNKMFKTFGAKNDMEKAVVNLLLSGTAVQDFLENENNPGDVDDGSIKNLSNSSWKLRIQVMYWRMISFFRNPFYQLEHTRKTNIVLENFDPALFAKNILTERKILISKQNKFLKENPRFNNVFYIISPRHRVRRFCQKLVRPSYGERIDGVEPSKKVAEAFVVFVFLATIALVVTACYLTPLYRISSGNANNHKDWGFYLEIGFLAFFSLEFTIKVLADGLILTPNAYLRSSWNFIDFIVLISLWIEFIALLKNNGNVEKIVRGLKALRALRLLTVSETAKYNFHNTLISGFWKIINAGIISLCLLFPFSIWALNVFNGRLGYCIDGVSDQDSCINEYAAQVFDWEIMSPNIYRNPQLEFDKFTGSFATLYEIVSLEGWVDLLENLMQSTGIGTVPEKNYAPYNGAFIVAFNFTSTVFILTLFVSVIISNYSKTTGRAYQTHDQIAWTQVAKILGQVQPSKRKDTTKLSRFRKFCYGMTVEKNKYWTYLLNIILFLHVLSLLMQSFPARNIVNEIRVVVFMTSSTLFFINALMLLIAQGFKTFVKYKWNSFYLFVSFGAFATSFIGFFVNKSSSFTNVQELFLVGLLSFIIPRSNRLSQLLRFASASLPTLFSLLFTWGVVFLLFAIAMNQIFGLTKIGPNGTDNLNLRSVPKALVLLFRCSFGEGWNYIMEDYTVESPFCTTGSTVDASDCGNKQYAYFLFCVWNLLSMYIFLNMFVSLILDSFNYIGDRTRYGRMIEREEIRKFKRKWQNFDPKGTGYISPSQLPKLLHSLEGSLSFHFYKGDLEIPKLCKRWITRNNVNDPYDVSINHEAINEVLENMDVPKIRERRKSYEQFMEEAILKMEINNDPGISFTRILLQLPLYTSFDAGQCLNLFDFLERRLLLKRVEQRLKTKRVYELIATYACRWKYQENKRAGIRDSNIGFDTELKRNSYFNDSDDESYRTHKPGYFEDEHNPFYNNPFDDRAQAPFTSNASNIFDSSGPTSMMPSEGTSSGIYVPNSPLNTFKRVGNSNETYSLGNEKLPIPKIYINVNDPTNREGTSSDLDDNKLNTVNGTSGLVDLSTLSESFSNSSWNEAFKEVQSENSEDFWKHNAKSD
jgi:hypothetical protein